MAHFFPSMFKSLLLLCSIIDTNIVFKIIRALNYLHKQKQIVHRDLKPANLMVRDDDKLTISKCSLSII